MVAQAAVDIERHQRAVEVKGATLTALEVAKQPDEADLHERLRHATGLTVVGADEARKVAALKLPLNRMWSRMSCAFSCRRLRRISSSAQLMMRARSSFGRMRPSKFRKHSQGQRRTMTLIGGQPRRRHAKGLRLPTLHVNGAIVAEAHQDAAVGLVG